MKVLIACEESQTITKAMRQRNIDAYSCDIQDCSGGREDWHIKGDALKEAYSGKYEMMIAHPPCTYLATAGAPNLYMKDGSRNEERFKKRAAALQFVRDLMNAPIKRIAIENPIGAIATHIRPADCIVHPYHFGDQAQKTTCWWLKNLKPLQPTDIVDKGAFIEWISKKGVKNRVPAWYGSLFLQGKTQKEISKIRSRFFPGMAAAIANQWGDQMLNDNFEQLELF